jgi:hypothetical protein
MIWKRRNGDSDGIPHSFCSMACQSRAIPGSTPLLMTRKSRKMQQHRVSHRALHQCSDCKATQSQDEVSFPMARNGPFSGFHRACCDHDFSRQEMLASRLSACSRYHQRPSCSQAGHQFTLECPAPLDVQRLVDGLVRDPHSPIMRKIDLQSIGDLFRTPDRRPVTVVTSSMATTNPSGLWAYDSRAIRVDTI